MVTCLRVALLGSCWLGQPALGVAQKSVSVFAAAQLQVGKARFADQHPVADRLQLLPSGHSTFLAGASVALSPRYALHASGGRAGYGYRLHLQADEPGRKGTTTIRREATEYALLLRRHYQAATTPGRRWFAEIGLDLATTGPASPNFQSRSAAPSGAGMVVSGTLLRSNPNRLGVRLGAGREWRVGPREFLSLHVLGSVGLRDLQRYHLQTVTWQQGESIDPVHYVNTLANRGSFVGVQARYRFQWLTF